MDKSSKIYIAGHTGLVGSALVRKFTNEGYNNLVYTPWPEYDLRNQKQTNDFYKREKPEYVFLAAARVGGILANSTYPAEFIYDNIMISVNIIHASYVYGVRKLLNLGSSCVYPKHAPQPLKEEYLLSGPLEQTNEPYAIAKISAIKLCHYYNKQYGTNFISVMPTNLYGPGDNFDLETSHVLPALIRKCHLAKCLENNDWDSIRDDLNKRPIGNIDGKSPNDVLLSLLEKYGILSNNNSEIRNGAPLKVVLKLWGSGNPRREFLYVDDLADAIVFIMSNYNAKELGEFVNIGTGKELTILELSNIIKKIIGFKGRIDWDNINPDGTPQKTLNLDRLNKLGWKYKYSLSDGIKVDYQYYLRHLEKVE